MVLLFRDDLAVLDELVEQTHWISLQVCVEWTGVCRVRPGARGVGGVASAALHGRLYQTTCSLMENVADGAPAGPVNSRPLLPVTVRAADATLFNVVGMI